ncbi:hypothetical protein VNO77_27223 [Canavalia gladiata]|uniref:Uncharacterized protein n=1 Tax=Canavalia gladiata TaxID=3824 RepID=A0AAN9QAB1_CANGL
MVSRGDFCNFRKLYSRQLLDKLKQKHDHLRPLPSISLKRVHSSAKYTKVVTKLLSNRDKEAAIEFDGMPLRMLPHVFFKFSKAAVLMADYDEIEATTGPSKVIKFKLNQEFVTSSSSIYDSTEDLISIVWDWNVVLYLNPCQTQASRGPRLNMSTTILVVPCNDHELNFKYVNEARA